MSASIPGIRFGWQAGDGQRWKYVPFLTWDKIDKDLAKKEDHRATMDVFYKHLRKSLFEIYVNQVDNPVTDGMVFYSWLRDDLDKEMKISTYVSTYGAHFRATFPAPKTMATNFFRKIKGVKTMSEMEDCFNGYTSI